MVVFEMKNVCSILFPLNESILVMKDFWAKPPCI